MIKKISLDFACTAESTNEDIAEASQSGKGKPEGNDISDTQKDVEAVRMMTANHKVVKETKEFGLPHLLIGLRKGAL
ncbi:MAG: hypothetical protein J6N99_03135 [Schwartzia sp.]|nr:hypothetical protein [Schwartzia sp. (in: firmicutes)]